MYVAIVPNRGSPPAILLRESYRDGTKVKNRTLKNLSDWPAERIELPRALYRAGTSKQNFPRPPRPVPEPLLDMELRGFS